MMQYLENQDFTPDGHLQPRIHGNQPVFVMIQAKQCGHCTDAKPAFAKLAKIFENKGIVKIMTILADGERKSEQDLLARIRTIYPDIIGYPAYMLFLPNGRKFGYDPKAKRDTMALYQFIMKHIR